MLCFYVVISNNEDEISEELDFFINFLLDEKVGDGHPFVLLINGTSGLFSGIKNKIGARCNYYYLGKNPIDIDDVNSLLPLLAINAEKNTLDLVSFVDGETKEETIEYEKRKWHNPFFETLKELAKCAKSNDSYVADLHLKNLKTSFLTLKNETLSAVAIDTLTHYRNCIEVEDKFYQGDDKRAFERVTKDGTFLDLMCYSFDGIYDDYKSLVKRNEKFKIDEIQEASNQRLEYIDTCKTLRSSIQKREQREYFSMLLIWYSSYFITVSIKHMRDGKFSAAVVFLTRALECCLQAVLYYYNRGSFIRDGRFIIEERASKGVGSVWMYIIENLMEEKDKNRFCIDQVIRLRNHSTSGHGFSPLNKEIFDKCYTEILDTIKFFDKKMFPSKNYWGGLSSLNRCSILGNIDKNISRNILEGFSLSL